MTFSLQVEQVSYNYEGTSCLHDITFDIPCHSFLAMIGKNGAGKSTLFNLIIRLLPLQKGSIAINGHSLHQYQKALQKVGIVFQESTLDLDLTVKQNLYYYGALRGLSFKETLDSIKTPLQELELDALLNTPVRKLNGGHKRRVEIARALINEPNLLLFDEPTTGLDVNIRKQLVDYINTLVKRQEISVLWITHLFDELDEHCNIIHINKGIIAYKGHMKGFEGL